MLKILVVDENKEFRNYFNEMITSRSDQYLELADASNLENFYRRHIPDLVIIDLQIKNAFRAVKELIEEFPQARVLILADFDDERLKMKAAEVGAAAFLSKENLFDFYKTINDNKNLNH
jgi:DNA-binding NarL/FixJ family response regulator